MTNIKIKFVDGILMHLDSPLHEFTNDLSMFIKRPLESFLILEAPELVVSNLIAIPIHALHVHHNFILILVISLSWY
jgi:hypothetical protein